jgi:hypothetical protein
MKPPNLVYELLLSISQSMDTKQYIIMNFTTYPLAVESCEQQ